MAEEELKPTIIPLSGKLVTARDPMVLNIGDFQDLTNMRYKRRNPISLLGMAKFNETTVVDGTASPGTYMKTRQGFHFRKDTPTDMGSDYEAPEFDPDDPPNVDALWAYFKFDEGSGLTIQDYSPLAEDGALVTTFGDPTTKFWSVSGFGHNDSASPITWVARTATAVRNCTYISFIGFIKPYGSAPWVDDELRGFVQLGEGGVANWMRIMANDDSPNQWCIRTGAMTATAYSSNSPTANTWYCIYAVSDASTAGGTVQLYTRVSGGEFVLQVDTTNTYARTGTQSGVYAFGSNNGSAYATMGDVLYYAYNTSLGCITLAQANIIYDGLKSRYGMT